VICLVVLFALKIIEQKHPVLQGCFIEFEFLYSWCRIKDDYRTLVDLEDVNVVNLYSDTNEKKDDA
jgi:hypothetical protein